MNLIWTGTNWALTAVQEPARPWVISEDSPSIQAYNVWGDSRIYAPWHKRRFVFSWPSATAAIDLNVRSMIQDGGRVQLLSDIGTFYIAPLPESYTCSVSGWGAYAVSCEFIEV